MCFALFVGCLGEKAVDYNYGLINVSRMNNIMKQKLAKQKHRNKTKESIRFTFEQDSNRIITGFQQDYNRIITGL